MCDKTFFFVVKCALTTGRLAELGFRGVQIRKRNTTALRCGDKFNLGRQYLIYIGLFISFIF